MFKSDYMHLVGFFIQFPLLKNIFFSEQTFVYQAFFSCLIFGCCEI